MVEHRLELFRELALGNIMNQAVFLDAPLAGSSSSYVICNSVPKSGTYLLVELVKALGGHVDVGYHTYSSSISRVHANGSFDYERAIPAPLWASAMKPGYLCASHTEYCPHLEQYFLARKEHRMLFIVRDPRDLVISWVDFVYNSTSYPKMRRWNAYVREAGAACHPDDASKITSCIRNLPRSGIQNFMSWIDLPACLTVKFEELYSELTEKDPLVASFPVIDSVCDYLGVPRKSPSELADVVGRGLTWFGRDKKIGAYLGRMTPHHFRLLCNETFQKLVVEFGYEPTRRMSPSQISRGLAALRNILPARSASGSF